MLVPDSSDDLLQFGKHLARWTVGTGEEVVELDLIVFKPPEPVYDPAKLTDRPVSSGPLLTCIFAPKRLVSA